MMSEPCASQLAGGDSARLLQLINGFQTTQAIYAIATLGIPDLLRDKSLTSDELAVLTGTHPRALYRLLRALAAVGLFHEECARQFALTSLGHLLRSEVAGSRAAWARNVAQPSVWEAWGNLLHSIRTEETAFRHVHGRDVWRYRSGNPKEGAVFDLAMREGSTRIVQALRSSHDFAQFRCIVDVGGGDGTLLAGLLTGNLDASGVLFDLPHVVAAAPTVLNDAHVRERCTIVGGNFFNRVPSGGDAYVLKLILHDWDDEQALTILRNCRRAMASGAKLFAIERLLAPPNEGAEGKLSDLNMLVNAGGRERNLEEFAVLLEGAGFALISNKSFSNGLSLLVGEPREGNSTLSTGNARP
jgi:hypothetical protein